LVLICVTLCYIKAIIDTIKDKKAEQQVIVDAYKQETESEEV
jgi:hypothetical protein